MFFVNPNKQKCGVYQFGTAAFEAIRELGFTYTEDLNALPRNSIYLFNWHPSTNLGVLNAEKLQYLGGTSLGCLHDPYHDPPFFNIKLRLDPMFVDRHPYYGLPRILADFQFDDLKEDRISVGSWGFGLNHKNYDRVIRIVDAQLNNACVRLHIPFSDWCDASGQNARLLAEQCRSLARYNVVEITHDYMDLADFVKWAHGNTINIFTCSETIVAGISSCVDMALMAKRPIGVSRSMMYKHVYDDRTSLDTNSLTSLIEQSPEHLEKYRRQWTPRAFREKIRLALSTIPLSN